MSTGLAPTFNLQDAITRAVQQQVAQIQIPPDKKGIAIMVVDETGVHAGGAVRVGDHVQIDGELEKLWSQPGWRGHVQVTGTF